MELDALENLGLKRIWSTDIKKHIGEEVTLKGWIHNFRELGNVSFLVLRDGKGEVQAVVSGSLAKELASLQRESVLEIEGKIIAQPKVALGAEMVLNKLKVLSPITEPPPIEIHRKKINAELPTILDHAALTLRAPLRRAATILASDSLEGFRKTLRELDFTEIHTPKIVGASTEGGANVFAIDYFEKKAFLAQSPQFYKQTMVGALERVYEVGPVFRAEPHSTQRHLNEYTSLDAEMGFIKDHTTVMKVLTKTIAGMLEGMTTPRSQRALKLRGIELPDVPEKIPSIYFSEAQQIITTATGEDLTNDPDLAPSHEKFLGEWAKKNYGSAFLFVVGYPMAKRPFYTYPNPEKPEFSNSFDLLFNGLELVTGGQRLHLYEDYLKALSKRGMQPAPFKGYLEAFKYGMPPHGGFAIGLERWVAQILGESNIRET